MTKYYDKEKTTEENSGEKETEKISEEDVGKDEIDLGSETPTLPAEENDNKTAVEETPKNEPAEREEPVVTEKAEPIAEEVVEKAKPEPEKEDDPAPEEGEEHEVFCNRYMNHPNILRRITPAYRRAAAEATWKQHHV